MSNGINIDFSALKSPDFVGDYVNALKVGQDLGKRADEARGPQEALASMGSEARVAAARRAELLSAVGTGLAQFPYGQRRTILVHMGPDLAAQGLAPGAIEAFDPTDANLAAHLATTRSLIAALAGPAPFHPEQAAPHDGAGL